MLDEPGSHSVPGASAAAAIRISGLEKVYRAQAGQPPMRALRGVSLEIPRGSIFGLLGPNGAGKSTLINILAGLVVKSGGQVEINGHDLDEDWRQARLSIGVMPQELVLDPFFTPRQTLELQAGLYGVPSRRRQTEALLEMVGLADKADVYSRTLSGGMRRRLMMAKALVHRPPIVILDEPTAGVDIELRELLWNEVRYINEAGATILLTTHHFEEVEAICDRIAIINRGSVTLNGPMDEMLARLDRKELVIQLAEPCGEVPATLADLDARLQGDRTVVIGYQPTRTRTVDLLGRIRDSELQVADLSTREPNLEDLFRTLTSEPVLDAARP
ncbi:MAG: ABC transporter ATP-binding protein [Alphaproteobacteria bacterium]|nr:ABC transporter ATP-binding protein [Alphaproteobacteria bacterium]